MILLLLKPPKADVPPVGNGRSCLIVVVTLHLEMVVSAGKGAYLQRVAMVSSSGEFSISIFAWENLSCFFFCFVFFSRNLNIFIAL